VTNTNHAEPIAHAGASAALEHRIKTFNSADLGALAARYASDPTLSATTSPKNCLGRAEIRSGRADFLRPRDTHTIRTSARFSYVPGRQDGCWYVLHYHLRRTPLAPSD